MEVNIVMTDDLHEQMLKVLFPSNSNAEQFGFIVTGLSEHKNGCNLLCRTFIPADESCLTNQSGASVVPDPRFVQYVYNIVTKCKGGVITVHTHPFSNENVCFSGIDDRSEADSFPKEIGLLGAGPHASMVLGRNSVDARWYDAKIRRIKPVKKIKIIGDTGTKNITPTSQRNTCEVMDMVGDIHHRQVLAFGLAGQRLIRQTKVGIVGCGGLGSILLILLVRLGVRGFVLVDNDTVEESNLNRLAGSRLLDVQNKTPKVEMLGKYAQEISPATRLDLIAESVFSPSAQLALRSCDYIFGGVDAQSPRVLLNSLSVQHMIPYIDLGTGIQADSSHNIEHAGGQVRTVIPGLGCLKCIKGIDLDTAQMEHLPEADRQFVVERGYIAGEDEHAPSVASLNGVVANLAVTEFMGYVTGCKPLSRYVFYDFMKSATVPVEFKKNPNCFSCSEDSLLGCGDGASAMPDLLIPKQSIEMQGDTKMSRIRESIEEFIASAQERSLHVTGNADELWFVVDDIALDSRFSAPTTRVMIRFEEDSNDPQILIPEDVCIDPSAAISDTFIDSASCIEGWHRVFPNLFLDVDGEVVELLFSLAGVLGNLSLYDFVSPESIEKPNEEEFTAEFISTNESNDG